MKNNRKNRKLKFIRTKNRLRTGRASFYVSEKVSDDMPNAIEYVDDFKTRALKALFRIYKIKFKNPICELDIAMMDDDFATGLHTYVFKISLK